MDGALGSAAGSRAPSSTPATPLEEQSDQQARLRPSSVLGGSVGTARPANEVGRAGSGVCEPHEDDTQPPRQGASGRDLSQQQEGRPPKRIKNEFGGKRWTKEEELALLEIRKGKEKVTWAQASEKMVAKGFPQRSATALHQRYLAMDGAGENPRTAVEQDTWTDEERLALLAIVTHQDSSDPGGRRPSINWSSWQAAFPGRTRYQIQQKANELRKLEDSAKTTYAKRQADRMAREAAIEARWQSLRPSQPGGGRVGSVTRRTTATSTTDSASPTLEEFIAACSATGPAVTVAPSTVSNLQVPSNSGATHSFVPIPSAPPPFHASSSRQLDTFLSPQQTTASSRPSALQHPSSSTMSAQLEAYLDFAIDAALATDPPVPPSQNIRPLHPLNHTTLGQLNSAQQPQQYAFAPREQQHQPFAAASVVAPASPTKQPVVAAEIAGLVVDASGKAMLRTTTSSAHEPVTGGETEKREEPMWRTDLGDEEDTSWVPKSKSGLKLEEKLRGIARRLRE
ncbi:Proteophosphoglycan 5 [Rhodotorula toruloides ATCC 204091]|uniref:Proteophosphoglycan 5 n=1 Tax=Rhodotorula toruloides TaxID=5286 RepID=A0A0K3CRB1_RHOTO|nr:Proteophosphoglycan 5 [Rhodotorula toruloides ATCC 204091]KAK4331165.1 Proteophosphoglycan 5 [Rhodotorula toruloides]PRQ70484.1 Proteophosphoglycan 5 [Rhodotorula toruloides]